MYDPYGRQLRGLACLLVSASLLGGCSEDEPEFVCEANSDAARACCDFARTVLENCERCNPDSKRDCVDSVTVAIDETSNGSGCKGADAVRDMASFYAECLPALRALACTDKSIPESCAGQLTYD